MASELEHTNTLSNDFINNFSHEFKTPIVSIAGFAKLLKKGNIAPEQQSEYLTIIEDGIAEDFHVNLADGDSVQAFADGNRENGYYISVTKRKSV